MVLLEHQSSVQIPGTFKQIFRINWDLYHILYSCVSYSSLQNKNVSLNNEFPLHNNYFCRLPLQAAMQLTLIRIRAGENPTSTLFLCMHTLLKLKQAASSTRYIINPTFTTTKTVSYNITKYSI